jgi:hypothetical protein
VPACAEDDEETAVMDEIYLLIRSHKVLSLEELDQLRSHVNELNPQDNSVHEIEQLSISIFSKIKEDKGKLEKILINLELLSKNSHAKKFSDISGGVLDRAQDAMDDFEQKFKNLRPSFERRMRSLDYDYHRLVIDNNMELLEQLPGVWEIFNDIIEYSYSDWKAEYDRMQNDLNSFERQFHGRVNLMSYEELKFLDVFQKMTQDLTALSSQRQVPHGAE